MSEFLFDKFREKRVEAAKERADVGIEQSATKANANGWVDDAKDVLFRYLLSHRTFFCDEFWECIEKPENGRALGAVIRHASKQKWMEQTGQYRNSTSSNMSAKPVWRSLIYLERDIDE